MRIAVTIPVTVDVEFDVDDSEISAEELKQDACYAVMDVIQTDIVADSIVEAISDYTGWLITGMTLSTPDAG